MREMRGGGLWGLSVVRAAAVITVGVAACTSSPSEPDTRGSGGGGGLAAVQTGNGGATGGRAASSGGAATGGATSTGGTAGTNEPTGPQADAGTSTGGSSTGGTATGGAVHGSADGGAPQGGSGGASAVAGAPGGGKGGAGGVGGAPGNVGGSAGSPGAPNVCAPFSPSTGGMRYCSNSKGNAGAGYKYELWASGQGSGCMNVYGVGANYSASWTGVTDFLARAGLQFDQTKTPAQIGTISANFAETKTEVPTEGKTSKIYLAVYGWTVNPLAEYYVIEDYGAFVPGPMASDGTPRNHMGTIAVDDGVYDVWALDVKGKPAITGDNKDFTQIFSVRQARRQCGHVSVSQHFTQWAAFGLTLGKLEETMFLMEAQGNSGTVDVTSATITVQ